MLQKPRRPHPASIVLFAAALAIAAGPRLHAAEIHVTVQDTMFNPAEVFLQPGDSVTWTNTGIQPHNARADDDSFRCANGCDGAGGDGMPAANAWTATVTFATSGDVPYFCESHGAPGGLGMSGEIHVRASTPIHADGFESGDLNGWTLSVSDPP